jgi:phage terminase large subunit
MGDNFDSARWNKTNHIYTFETGSEIEFFSADQPDKLRGGRRDILYINECNNVPYEAFMELDIRTRLFTFLDWNPVSEFWVHEKGLCNVPENVYIHSTYRDALNVLPPDVVRNIESNRDRDTNWWNVYGLGRIGKIDGVIYPRYTIIDEFPAYGDAPFYGMDFGYNDPATLIRCKFLGDSVVFDQLIYETGLTNQDLSRRMSSLGIRKHHDEIIADCAEPKSIAELYREGWNIHAAVKGPDSVNAGIQKVKQYKIFVTKRSVEMLKEFRNYTWMRDKEGKILDRPSEKGYDHCLDAARYAVSYKLMGATGQALRIAI